ncbi:MAG: hypothetical protein Q9159_006469 [Coniocarpon cinnabarinum]
MTLEDFERQLAREQAERDNVRSSKRKRSRSTDERHSHRRHNRHSNHHREPSRHYSHNDESHKRHRRRSKHRDGHEKQRERLARHDSLSDQVGGKGSEGGSRHEIEDGSTRDTLRARELEKHADNRPSRMSWMQGPAGDAVENVRSKRPKTPPGPFRKAKHVQPTGRDQNASSAGNGGKDDRLEELPSQHQVNYAFGDAGSAWRMKKLSGIYREAEETGKSVDDIAVSRYGSIRDFDDAREEEIEMDRRNIYGENYVGKEKPSGDLFEERKINAGLAGQRGTAPREANEIDVDIPQAEAMDEDPAHTETLLLDQTTLNRMKADVMRAQLRKDPKAADLEAKYNAAMASAANIRQPDVVVLNRMENRMLAGGRQGEVAEVSGKRGRERGLVQENEDMSVDDMVRQERRTRGQFAGDGRAFAERIAKDGKFNDDLEYMDDNAEKLAKSVQKSDINLRNTSIQEYHKIKKILDTCPLCSDEDANAPPTAPVVSLGTRTFLTLPTSPEITPYGFCATIAPTQHRLNLLECDDDEWEEIRNFMKSLTRFYYNLKPQRSVIFYENAAHEGRKRHASLEAIPIPMSLADTIPQYFKEAILSADEEWTQHKKIIDTLKNSEKPGFGRHAFRKSMVSELPYFHVWFRIDGGLGHVVEDPRRWPKGDLFAREIIGGILDVGPEVIKKQGRWRKGDLEMQSRVKAFKDLWDVWDWTKALLEPS